MISCKKAGLLLSKKEENKLNWLEKMQLKGHSIIIDLNNIKKIHCWGRVSR